MSLDCDRISVGKDLTVGNVRLSGLMNSAKTIIALVSSNNKTLIVFASTSAIVMCNREKYEVDQGTEMPLPP